MRHRKRGRKLGRSPKHQRALLKSLASALFLTERDAEFDENKPKVKGRMITTISKAKEVRPLVEKCITIARKGLLAEAVVQVPVSEHLLNLPEEWRSVRFIAHSPFSFLRRHAERDGKIATLSDLLKALSETCHCDALVCSMFGADHLKANVAAWKACT